MSNTDQFYIRPSRRIHAALYITGNLLVSFGLLAFAPASSDAGQVTDLPGLVLGGLSVVTVLAIFMVTSLVTVTAVPVPLLLLGLLLFQLGRLLEVVGDAMAFKGGWLLAADALILSGEFLLAAFAIYFVRVSSRFANLDGLTGLYNRSFHMMKLPELLRQAGPVGLICIDLDRFKAINDEHGHAYGDQVLQHAARLLKQYRRNGHVVSRTGGEEFEIAVPDASREQLLQLAEQVRASLEDNPPQKLAVLTASIGAAISRPDDDSRSLRDRADEGAYIAKKNGRNRVVLVD